MSHFSEVNLNCTLVVIIYKTALMCSPKLYIQIQEYKLQRKNVIKIQNTFENCAKCKIRPLYFNYVFELCVFQILHNTVLCE